ncbi:DUF6731 family protein [Mesorhizobium loti]|uniref:DUF6731 family protein n=1 Tax=Rhizobium loti TaxID=381 RepID=UPI0012BCFAAA|nr:DUF6731 family protein [Mesorhizobium loti]
MDKTITVRYYSIKREKKASIPNFVDMFREIYAIKKSVSREKLLSTDYTIRLENLEDDGANAVVGELIRCQNTNLPGELKGDAIGKLTADRLGHSVVFRYNHKVGILGIQHDVRVISPGRLLEYVAAFNPQAIYSMAPRLNKDAWKKFRDGEVRKLSIRIANPDSMEDLTGTGKAASAGIRAMAEAYNAPTISVDISMGHHKGTLSTAVVGLAKQLLAMAGGARLDALSAIAVVNDESEYIDLIEDRMMSRSTLGLDDRDPDINWKIKRGFICSEMKKLVG